MKIGTKEEPKAAYRADHLRHPWSSSGHQHGYQLPLLLFTTTSTYAYPHRGYIYPYIEPLSDALMAKGLLSIWSGKFPPPG